MASARLEALKKYRQLKRRLPEADTVSHLNITAMMDMMTILVVFFLKSFSRKTLSP
jgi:biopolymer transport protein ExbD